MPTVTSSPPKPEASKGLCPFFGYVTYVIMRTQSHDSEDREVSIPSLGFWGDLSLIWRAQCQPMRCIR